MSATAIAEEINHGATRNAVIGKIHRMKLQREQGYEHEHPRRQQSARVGSETRRQSKESETFQNQGVEPMTDADIPISQRRTLFELADNDCRWPCGDPGRPGFFFCGGPRVEGLPYCAGHSRVAYRYTPAPVSIIPFPRRVA